MSRSRGKRRRPSLATRWRSSPSRSAASRADAMADAASALIHDKLIPAGCAVRCANGLGRMEMSRMVAWTKDEHLPVSKFAAAPTCGARHAAARQDRPGSRRQAGRSGGSGRQGRRTGEGRRKSVPASSMVAPAATGSPPAARQGCDRWRAGNDRSGGAGTDYAQLDSRPRCAKAISDRFEADSGGGVGSGSAGSYPPSGALAERPAAGLPHPRIRCRRRAHPPPGAYRRIA
jgi:hypothetical protein